MEKAKGLEPLLFEGNVSENWRKWLQKYYLHLCAHDKTEKSEPTKVAILLTYIGDEGLEVYNNFTYDTQGDELELEKVVGKFQAYCNPRKNTVIERCNFWEVRQVEGQTIDQYITELKTRARNCEFGDQTELMIRDRIIFGVADTELKQKLLRDSDDPSLRTVVELCRAFEAANAQMKATEKVVHVIKKKEKRGKKGKPSGDKSETGKPFNCKRCGTKHQYAACPAYGKECGKCHKKNHYSKICFSQTDQTPKNFHTLEQCDSEELFVGTLNIKGSSQSAWFEQVSVDGHLTTFKLDTGAEANVLPLKTFQKLNIRNSPLRPTNTTLIGYGNNRIKTEGKIILSCETTSQKRDLEFCVVDVESPPVLGLKACQQLSLVQRTIHSIGTSSPITKEELISRYEDNFKGLGKFSEKYHIELDPTVKPVIHPPRKVPYSLQEKLKDTLDKLEKADVVAKVEQPTDWVQSLVIVEKPNKSLRLCLDPKDLNMAVKREHFKIPTPDDIASQLSGKTVFSILDEKDGYWHVQLDEASSFLCTFNTPFGRYRFKRMPFGLCSASEVFQKRNADTFGDIHGLHMVSDDMIIAASNTEEHDKILQKVMERAGDKGVKFNKDKIQLRVPEVKYLGNIVSKDGLRPDEDKIAAIVDMPTPECKQDIQRLLGTLNFLSQYIPNMSEVTAPLRSLLKKENQWTWQHEHDTALKRIKTILTSKPVLKFYNVNQSVTIQADASQFGLGACLMQDSHPIAYSSRALTSAEVNYAQIEKELLAIVFACEKFHQYVYGKVINVQSDHKPLETILRKPLSKAAPRLQRMIMRLQRYQLAVKYVPGKFMHVADTLSRAFLPTTTSTAQEIHDDANVMIHTIKESLPVSAEKLQELQEATRQDPVMQDLSKILKTGWPSCKKNAPPKVLPYWSLRDEIHEIDGLIMIGKKLVIPTDYRSEILKAVHQGHLGIEKCKARARPVLYWPGMGSQIEDMVARCATCAKYQRANQREPLISHPIPNRRWQKVGVDLFEWHSKDYLLIVDYFSKFTEVCLLKDKTAETVITQMKSVFSRHGIPDEVFSDNMPFASKKFKDFSRAWEFKATTSSPTYPRSNGMVERAIQTHKRLLTKAAEDQSDPYLALLALRNSPVAGMTHSPAELLMSRRLRSPLPTSAAALQPKVVVSAPQQLQKKQANQKKYYDKGTRDLAELKQGESVLLRKEKTWEPATVTAVHDAPRSYIVTSNNGQTVRRNRSHLSTTPTEIPSDTTPSTHSTVRPREESNSIAPTAATTTPSNSATPTRSRPTRAIKPPERLKDFVVY